MTNQSTFPKGLHIALWTVQGLLAAGFAWGGLMKLIQPAGQLAQMWPWTGQVPGSLLMFTAIVDLLGALGLLLPALLRIQPILTPIAAVGCLVLMVCATVFHIQRGEAALITPNLLFAMMAAFVAWGRFIKVPVTSKR
ncbi:DoxX family protein [Arsenicibacter rosenii]|uniref:DoxX family protein n=1 Tax=Arsenicibacter rosenii TaxID=1750698 RepID=A0A1S2VKM5_9BACT|nr:DoxX family protein [Arsenicibacter rosenii]OIN59299.1 hypothetical protein BLX24_09950 [Arsenicibacter rosenii]